MIGTDTAFLLGALALVGPALPHPAAGLPADAVDRRRRRWRSLSSASSTPTSIDLVAAAVAVALPGAHRGCWAGWRVAHVRSTGGRRGAVGRGARVRAAPDDRRHGRGPARSPPTRRAARRSSAAPRCSGPSASRRCRASATRPGASLERAVSRQRAPADAAAPLDELRDRPAVRAGQRRRRPARRAARATRSRSPITWASSLGLVVGKLAGIGVAVAGRGAARARRAAAGRGLGPGARRRRALGHRLHRLAAHRRPRLRRAPRSATRRPSASCSPAVLATAARLVDLPAARPCCAASATAGLPLLLDRPVDPARDHIRGRADAPLTLVEYGDFECPFCGRATGAVHELHERFGDDLRYVFRHLPLQDVHPHAELAAAGGRGGGRPGALLGDPRPAVPHQDQLEYEDLLGYAGRARPRRRALRARPARGASSRRACAATSRAPRPAARAGRRRSSWATAATSARTTPGPSPPS